MVAPPARVAGPLLGRGQRLRHDPGARFSLGSAARDRHAADNGAVDQRRDARSNHHPLLHLCLRVPRNLTLFASRSSQDTKMREMSRRPFQAFLDEHRSPVLAYLRAMVGPSDADDCFQETFMAALRSYETLDGANPRAWVMTIARNKAIDHHRSAARRPLPKGDDLPDVAGSCQGRARSRALGGGGRASRAPARGGRASASRPTSGTARSPAPWTRPRRRRGEASTRA